MCVVFHKYIYLLYVSYTIDRYTSEEYRPHNTFSNLENKIFFYFIGEYDDTYKNLRYSLAKHKL